MHENGDERGTLRLANLLDIQVAVFEDGLSCTFKSAMFQSKGGQGD